MELNPTREYTPQDEALYQAYMANSKNEYSYDKRMGVLQRHLCYTKDRMIRDGITNRYQVIDIPEWMRQKNVKKNNEFLSDFGHEVKDVFKNTEELTVIGIKGIVKFVGCVFLIR